MFRTYLFQYSKFNNRSLYIFLKRVKGFRKLYNPEIGKRQFSSGLSVLLHSKHSPISVSDFRRSFSEQHKVNTIIDDSSSTKTCNHSDSLNLSEEANSISNLYDSIDYKEITGGDSDKLNKLKLLMLEVEVLRQDGMRIPKTLTTNEWKELFDLETRGQRRKFLSFLWLCEVRKVNDVKRKERKKIALVEKRAELEKQNESNNHIRYGFQGNTIFTRIYDSTINFMDNGRLIQAMLFGQNVVIDCSYDNDMTAMENKLCCKQLVFLFAYNRLDRDPFNIHFCNVNKSGILYNQLKKSIPPLEDPSFPINITEESYLDLFPKEKLVYLTPHCRTELKEFNHDDIYIIGAMVDRRNQDKLSLAKAKSQGIRMAQLPLDRYLNWGLGGKSLTINQVMDILLDIRTTGDWNSALRHVPQRKVRTTEDHVTDRRQLFNRNRTKPLPRYMRPIGYSADS